MVENETEAEVMPSPGIFNRVRNRLLLRSRSQEPEVPVADPESGGDGVKVSEPEAVKFTPTDEVTDPSTVLESQLKSMKAEAKERDRRQEERAKRQDEKLAAMTEQLSLLTKLMKASSGMSVDESNEPSGSSNGSEHSGDEDESYVDESASVHVTDGSSVHETDGIGTVHSLGSALHGDDRGGFARNVIGKKDTPSPPGDSRSEVASSVCTSGGTKFKYGEHWRKEMCLERHISDINRRICSNSDLVCDEQNKLSLPPIFVIVLQTFHRVCPQALRVP